MPIYSRRSLRQRLGREWLRDTVVGTTSGSWGTQAGSANIVDLNQADPTASGEQMYYRHHLRLLGSAGFIQDLRVASFNTGSGAYMAAQTLATAIYSGMPFEVSGLISPSEKDLALNAVIKDVRVRQEFPIWAIANGHTYSMGTDIKDILDVRYYSDPTDSLNLGSHQIDWFRYDVTATGRQLQISPSLPASYQLIIDALLDATLGTGDLATVNLPNDDVVLWGAAARCYWLLEQHSPAQESGKYKERRQEAAREYSRLATRFAPKITSRPMLDEVY